MAIRYHHDLYPADDPRDGARVVRFTHHQKAHYEHVRNGAGSGLVELRGTTSDAQLIAPSGMQYVRVVEENTVAATEVVRGGYFFEEGDFLALDRKRLKKLKFGGTGTLSYLDREIMWSHSYLDELGFGGTMDPFDRIWRLWNQGDWAGGDYLGAILWRVIMEGLAYRTGATYTHRHATGDEFGVEFTDAHDDDDKLETAIPFVTLGFDQFEDSSGNAWTVGSGEFEAQVGDSLYEVTKRLMDAGLYVELDPDTFELRAWEVANHGRDRTGLAWGANVVRFEPPPSPSTDRSAGNILNDLKRALRPFIKVTSVLAGGGEDTYAVATASGTVPWHRFRALDINDTTALAAAATRDISRRNDAGDTLLVRSKVGDDPANGYYLPEKHAKLDDLVTVHSGTDTWDWDEAAYPIAKWSVTSRRTGAPDVFYHLGASYHAGASKEFAGGSGVGRHTHPPNPQLCTPGVGDVLLGLTESSLKVSSTQSPHTKDRACDGSLATHWSGANATDPPESYWAADLAAETEVIAYRVVQGVYSTGDYTGIPADTNIADEIRIYGSNDAGAWSWLPSGSIAADPASNGWTLVHTDTQGAGPPPAGDHGVTDFSAPATYRYWLFRAVTGGTGGNSWDVGVLSLFADVDKPRPLAEDGAGAHGTSNRATRCDHEHEHGHLTSVGPHHIVQALSTAETDTDLVLAPDGNGGVEFREESGGVTDHGALTGLADDDHPQYVRTTDGGKEVVNTVASSGASETLDLADGNWQVVTLTDNCTLTFAGATNGVGCSMRLYLIQDGTGNRTVTWPGSVVWPDDTPPVLSSAPGAVDQLHFETHDGGTTWYGSYPGSSSGTDIIGLIPVDTGSVAYDITNPGEVGVTVETNWGWDGTVAFYDDTGAAAGEEAALYYDPDSDEYVIVPFDFV